MRDNSKVDVGALIQGLLGRGLLRKFEYEGFDCIGMPMQNVSAF